MVFCWFLMAPFFDGAQPNPANTGVPGVGAVGAGRAAGIEFSTDAIRRADRLDRLSSSRSSDPGGGGADRGGRAAAQRLPKYHVV